MIWYEVWVMWKLREAELLKETETRRLLRISKNQDRVAVPGSSRTWLLAGVFRLLQRRHHLPANQYMRTIDPARIQRQREGYHGE